MKIDTYSIQSYYKQLCKVNYIAYDELRKVKIDIKSGLGRSIELNFWEKNLTETEALLEKIIKMIDRYEIKIVITSKEEILPLIRFYVNKGFPKDSYMIINLNPEFTEILPKDEISQEFIKAYNHRSVNEMKILYKKTYVKDIII